MKNKYLLLLFIFLFTLGTHFLSKTTTISDSRWTLHTAMSLLKTHDLNLDEYRPIINSLDNYGVEIIDGHYYYFFPIGTSLFIAPFLKIIDFVARQIWHFDLNDYLSHNIAQWNNAGGAIERFLASLIVAFSAVFVFLFCRQITHSTKQSLLLVFVFAFCTSAWSTASRNLWSHGSSMLFLSIGLYSLLKAKSNIRWLIVAALALAYSYVIRPTNSLSVFFFTLYVLFYYRRYFLVYCLCMAAVLLPFFLYNEHIYHDLFSTYYAPNRAGINNLLWEGLVGNLFSPARGLFVFSSVLIFSLAGIIFKVFNKTFTVLDTCVLLVILAHYYVISSITTLYGGWCFGPRLFTDVTPFFIYFLAFFIRRLVALPPSIPKLLWSLIFTLTVVTSFYINGRGATRQSTSLWNENPNFINDHPERIWDWHDLQFLR